MPEGLPDLDELDAAILAYCCEQFAANYYGGSLSLRAGDAARYLAEGVLERELPHIGWRDLWRYAREYLTANMHVLTLSAVKRGTLLLARHAVADEHNRLALEAHEAGDLPLAAAHIYAAQLAAPLYIPDGTSQRWSRILGYLSTAHETKTAKVTT